MAKYVYPAIFHEEEGGVYSVSFPDVSGCYTHGTGLADACEMAQDALSLMMVTLENKNLPIPKASAMSDVSSEAGDSVSFVSCDTVEYRKLFDNKAVKKTLTVPAWLNTMAENAGVNFSFVLQNALKKELKVTDR